MIEVLNWSEHPFIAIITLIVLVFVVVGAIKFIFGDVYDHVNTDYYNDEED